MHKHGVLGGQGDVAKELYQAEEPGQGGKGGVQAVADVQFEGIVDAQCNSTGKP